MRTIYALITGATGGIGQAVAKKLADSGYSLYLHYNSNQEKVDELIETLSYRHPNAHFFRVFSDLKQSDGAEVLLNQLEKPIECFINNAGFAHQELIQDTAPENLDEQLRLGLKNPVMLTKALIEPMIKHKYGRIVFVTSIWGLTGAATETVYSMIKGGQNSFVKALAKELAPSGITVNAVAPGAIETSMNQHLLEDERRDIMEDIPVGRFGKPEEVAATIDFLLMESAGYMNGQILSVNGAWHC